MNFLELRNLHMAAADQLSMANLHENAAIAANTPDEKEVADILCRQTMASYEKIISAIELTHAEQKLTQYETHIP